MYYSVPFNKKININKMQVDVVHGLTTKLKDDPIKVVETLINNSNKLNRI